MRSNPTGDEEEPLWGAFTPGGKLMMGSDDEGFYIFNLIDQNTLDYWLQRDCALSANRVCKTGSSALTKAVRPERNRVTIRVRSRRRGPVDLLDSP
jgi:hypothetical protein